MRLTDFWERLEETLGPVYAHSWAQDVVLSEIGLTVDDAIRSGVDTRDIWRAVCAAIEVPSTLV